MGELCIWGPWWAFCNVGWYGYDCSLKLVAYTFLLKPRHIACVLIHCSGEVYCFLPHWVVPEITSLLLHLSLSLCTLCVPSYSFSCLCSGSPLFVHSVPSLSLCSQSDIPLGLWWWCKNKITNQLGVWLPKRCGVRVTKNRGAKENFFVQNHSLLTPGKIVAQHSARQSYTICVIMQNILTFFEAGGWD